MSGNANVLTVADLLERQDSAQIEIQRRQDKQFVEVRKDINELAKYQKENALAMKDLMVTLTESSAKIDPVKANLDKIAHDLHGEGGILDEINDLKTANKVKLGKKELLWRWLVPVGSFVSGVVLVLLGK